MIAFPNASEIGGDSIAREEMESWVIGPWEERDLESEIGADRTAARPAAS
jgi:hypothetical protein